MPTLPSSVESARVVTFQEFTQYRQRGLNRGLRGVSGPSDGSKGPLTERQAAHRRLMLVHMSRGLRAGLRSS